jgi:hypothetical protein
VSRTTQLLNAAADALEEGTDPFAPGWLGEHAVTFDECMSLAEELAMGARLLAWALDNPAEARAILNAGHTGLHAHYFMRAMEKINLAAR